MKRFSKDQIHIFSGIRETKGNDFLGGREDDRKKNDLEK